MTPRRRNPRLRGREMRGRHQRRKVSPLTEQKVAYVDYKDVELLKSFVSERAKIRSQRVSGNSRQQQREVAAAIKNAREMALLAYVRRPVTQRRTPRRRDPSRPTQPWDPSSPAMPPPGGTRPSEADDEFGDDEFGDDEFAQIMTDEVMTDEVMSADDLVTDDAAGDTETDDTGQPAEEAEETEASSS